MMNREDDQRFKNLEKRMSALEKKTANIPVKFGRGGVTATGEFVLHILNYFPAIPDEGKTEFLLHTVENQLYHAHSTYDEWRPLENWFSGTGEPTAPEDIPPAEPEV